MRNPLLRLGAGLAASAGAVVAYLISPGLAIALGVGFEIVLLGAAFVATPLVLGQGPNGTRTKLWVVLFGLFLVIELVRAAISGPLYMAVGFALVLLAFAVFMVRSLASTFSRHR